jgi:cysteine desulfurase
VKLESLIHGAGHESGRRAGTESAMLAVALGAACELAQDLSWTETVRELRDGFWKSLQERLGDAVRLNGHPQERLPNTVNVSFVGCNGTEMIAALEGIAASTGSACHSGRIEISPVLRAMGVPGRVGAGAVRFSLGRGTSREEIDEAVARIGKAYGLV